jgi:hypothetical protein
VLALPWSAGELAAPSAKPADVPGVAITRDNAKSPRNVTLLLGSL